MNYKFKKISVGALKCLITYAITWALVFCVCLLIDKIVADASTATILQYVKYAGYPLFGIGWGLGMTMVGILYLIGQIMGGALYLLKFTFPYCLYAIGITSAIWGFFKIIAHLKSNTGPTHAEIEAEERHAQSMRVVRGAMLYRSISDLNKK